MAILKMTAEEIKVLRKTLKMSEAELANRIELEDRQAVKLLESGGMAPSVKMHRLLIRLLRNGATRSPKLKKMLEAIKERSEVRFLNDRSSRDPPAHLGTTLDSHLMSSRLIFLWLLTGSFVIAPIAPTRAADVTTVKPARSLIVHADDAGHVPFGEHGDDRRARARRRHLDQHPRAVRLVSRVRRIRSQAPGARLRRASHADV